MRIIALAASTVAQVVTDCRLRRCRHEMVAQHDGPVCRQCGRAWIWARA